MNTNIAKLNTPESVKERLRPLVCDFCKTYTLFDTSQPWLSCKVCKRCYTCLRLRSERCELCSKWVRDENLDRHRPDPRGIL